MKIQDHKGSQRAVSQRCASPDPQSNDETIPKKNLIYEINCTHFQNRPVFCRFDHESVPGSVSLIVKTEPVLGSHMVCLWPKEMPKESIQQVKIKDITISNGKSRIDIEPDIRAITHKGFCLRLPESGLKHITAQGNMLERSYEGVKVRLNKGAMSVLGHIDTIRDNTLTVNLGNTGDMNLASFSLHDPVNLAFIKQNAILFTGQYIPMDIMYRDTQMAITLRPSSSVIHRFPPKRFRSPRHTLSPSPDANFIHPLHDGYVSMTVNDLSGSGFSVELEAEHSALLTGMILTDVELNFSGAFSILCSCQMVHKSVIKTQDGQDKTVCGFAFTDMSLDHHLNLSRILHQKSNRHIRICHPVDENSLWSFFFETGFIYSQKYKQFIENKEQIKETYRKLYSKSPSIARHFIYQEKGEIVGHLSMLRMFRDTWMIHHLAALKRSGVKAGLSVLNHLAWFCYNSMWLEACHMRFMMCYFRPENTFPNFFFKQFAERLNDPAGCSTDTFAYLTHRKQSGPVPELPDPWHIEPAGQEDLVHLTASYASQSGGLMIEALDLGSISSGDPELEAVYHDSGFKKQRLILSLKHKDRLKAVIQISITDTAINMSDLSNCLTVFVLDGNDLTRDIWQATLARLSSHFEQRRFPVLLYPLAFAEKQDITYQKKYILWVLATKYSDHYFQFLDEINSLSKQHN